MDTYQFIGAASGWGAQIRQCEDGPDCLFKFDIVQKLQAIGCSISSYEVLYPLHQAKHQDCPLPDCLPMIHEFLLRLCNAVKTTLLQGSKPVILGGDHSNAVGTWNGVKEYLIEKKQGPLALLWIDAHMDAHDEKTTPSGAWHGMPLAAMMGKGNPRLSALKRTEPVVTPDHLCLIGVRSFEEGEALFLRENNVKIYYIDEVRERGMGVVIKEAVESLLQKVPMLGVSLDLDVVDPQFCPGIGSPEPNGVSSEELLQALSVLHAYQKKILAYEIMEYNPHRDEQQKTAQLCLEALTVMLGKKYAYA